MIDKVRFFPKGLTIRELKEIVDGMAEKDEEGRDYEVFIEVGVNRASKVTAVWPANKREAGMDLQLESDAFEEEDG